MCQASGSVACALETKRHTTDYPERARPSHVGYVVARKGDRWLMEEMYEAGEDRPKTPLMVEKYR